jgi:glutamyl-tRNA reductase
LLHATTFKNQKPITRNAQKFRTHLDSFSAEFPGWSEMCKNAPIIEALKVKLLNMHKCGKSLSAHTTTLSSRLELNITDEHSMERKMKNMDLKMRTGYHPGCSR